MLKGTAHITTIDSFKLAEYITCKLGNMSHLKLQKLLYYIQAIHLAYFEKPLIDDEFEAWVHGPVSRKIYNSLKDHSVLYDEIGYVSDGFNSEDPVAHLKSRLTADQMEVIDEVLEEYGKLSALQLEALTHSESPWINARKGCSPSDRCTNIISSEIMRDYYRRQVYNSDNED